jgi:hypothetical protein
MGVTAKWRGSAGSKANTLYIIDWYPFEVESWSNHRTDCLTNTCSTLIDAQSMEIIGLTKAHECVLKALHEDSHLTRGDYTKGFGAKARFSSHEARPIRCLLFAENTITIREVTECLGYFYIAMTSRFWQKTCNGCLEWNDN